MIDLHVHTWRCRHAEGTADEYVRAAAEREVRTLTFTEHLPLAPELVRRAPGAAGYAMPLGELDEYVSEVRMAARIGDALGVEVLLGIEIDAVRAGFDHAAEMLPQYPFDLVLGSVHFIDDWAFDDPSRIERYAEWDLHELWDRYFADVAEAARAGLMDVMAHIDLVKKFGARPAGDIDHLYVSAASALADAGVAVEVNSAGLRKPCREIYPAPGLLRELFRARVPATLGSDAHTPAEVGMGLDEAVVALREAGYRSVLVFRDRVAEEVGLDEL